MNIYWVVSTTRLWLGIFVTSLTNNRLFVRKHLHVWHYNHGYIALTSHLYVFCMPKGMIELYKKNIEDMYGMVVIH